MHSTLAVLAILSTVASLPAQSPPLQARADAYVKALSSGSADEFEAMATANFTPALLVRTATQRAQIVARVHADFGDLTIVDLNATSPTHVEVALKGSVSDMPLSVAIDLEPSEPFKIAQVAIRAGGPEGGREGRGGPPPLPRPAVNGRMSDDEISGALDGYLAGLAKSGDFAGVVLVARNGRPIFQRPYGIADRQRNMPMTVDLRFNLASIGKAFTRTAVAQLIAAGKLKMSDTVGALLPDYPNVEAKAATIDQLLAFRVGIADFFGEAFSKTPKDRFQSNHDYFEFVAPLPLLFAPGARTQYCNGCYVVLGEIIARVSGMPYERYVQEHVFGPAGMKGAGFLSFGDPKVALGYTRDSPGSPWRSALDLHGHHGSAAGGAYATAADLLAFDNALRTHVLLDPKMTAWFFENPEDQARPRAIEPYGIAGGAPGANSSLESNGTWTVVTLGNVDPPNAVRVGNTLAQALYRP